MKAHIHIQGQGGMEYKNIIEAIRSQDKNHPFVQMKNNGGIVERTNSYQLLEMPDGTIGAFAGSLNLFGYYRGENAAFEHCQASIYRNNRNIDGTYNAALILADALKIIDFYQILQTFPQVQYAIQDHAFVDYLALAQHYELNTPLLDITGDIGIAAFFATHSFKGGRYVPLESGIGCIRGLPFTPLSFECDGLSERFHAIGLQAFKRPGIQCAFGWETKRDEDYANEGWRIYFHQNRKANQYIHNVFFFNSKSKKICNKCNLFPEEDVTRVAQAVKQAHSVTRRALEIYAEQCGKSLSDCEKLIAQANVELTKELPFALSSAETEALKREYFERPYGDVQLHTRLCCYL